MTSKKFTFNKINKVAQYPLPWAVSFDWSYGKNDTEVLWGCWIKLGNKQLSYGQGRSQIRALENAVRIYINSDGTKN